jgi:hypothetical protein
MKNKSFKFDCNDCHKKVSIKEYINIKKDFFSYSFNHPEIGFMTDHYCSLECLVNGISFQMDAKLLWIGFKNENS